MPSANIRMIAPTATLVARDAASGAGAALRAGGPADPRRAGWFQQGHLPSIENTERTLAPEAERFYRNGAPLLQRYLPFWLANLIDRMWVVVMMSIIAILIPLARAVPPLYQFRVRSRIFRWYRPAAPAGGFGGGALPELLSELDAIRKTAPGASTCHCPTRRRALCPAQ